MPPAIPCNLETPPLPRGEHHEVVLADLRVGNTPAHAGTSGPGNRSCSRSGKHPRLRGEVNTVMPPDLINQETPPLARGSLYRITKRVLHDGNTPARARKLVCCTHCAGSPWKHPRSRGESPWPRSTACIPKKYLRSRGETLRCLPRHTWSWKHPADAGKTAPKTLRTYRRRKHPRSREKSRWRSPSRCR